MTVSANDLHKNFRENAIVTDFSGALRYIPMPIAFFQQIQCVLPCGLLACRLQLEEVAPLSQCGLVQSIVHAMVAPVPVCSFLHLVLCDLVTPTSSATKSTLIR